MDVKRQQGGADQRDLLDEALMAALRHGATGEGGTGPGASEGHERLRHRRRGTSLDAASDGGSDRLGEPEPSLQTGEGE